MKKKTAIVTDSNSGITQVQAKELVIFVLPTPFFINEELFTAHILGGGVWGAHIFMEGIPSFSQLLPM